jgi:hypothetical protein
LGLHLSPVSLSFLLEFNCSTLPFAFHRQLLFNDNRNHSHCCQLTPGHPANTGVDHSSHPSCSPSCSLCSPLCTAVAVMEFGDSPRLLRASTRGPRPASLDTRAGAVLAAVQQQPQQISPPRGLESGQIELQIQQQKLSPVNPGRTVTQHGQLVGASPPSAPHSPRSSTLCVLCQRNSPSVTHDAYTEQTVDTCSACSIDAGLPQSPSVQNNFIGTLDDASLSVYSAPKYEGSVLPAQQAIRSLGERLCGSSSQVVLDSRLTLDQTVQSTLAQGEQLKFSLAIESFEFIPVDSLADGNFAVPAGRAGLLVLTSERLLCLTRSRSATSKLQFGPPPASQMHMNGLYELSHSLADRTWCFPIALRYLKHASLESRSTNEARSSLPPQRRNVTCCWCCDCSFRFTFDQPVSEAEISVEQAHVQLLRIALLLPPWSKPYSLRVTVDSQVPLIKLHHFTAQFHSLVNPLQS